MVSQLAGEGQSYENTRGSDPAGVSCIWSYREQAFACFTQSAHHFHASGRKSCVEVAKATEARQDERPLTLTGNFIRAKVLWICQ